MCLKFQRLSFSNSASKQPPKTDVSTKEIRRIVNQIERVEAPSSQNILDNERIRLTEALDGFIPPAEVEQKFSRKIRHLNNQMLSYKIYFINKKFHMTHEMLHFIIQNSSFFRASDLKIIIGLCKMVSIGLLNYFNNERFGVQVDEEGTQLYFNKKRLYKVIGDQIPKRNTINSITTSMNNLISNDFCVNGEYQKLIQVIGQDEDSVTLEINPIFTQNLKNSYKNIDFNIIKRLAIASGDRKSVV